ncbi:unnamed protein product [Protopolystoma xenopodis]|uniref:Peptidase M13 N-terminal domain-containing protein n=1 Tax=Protopolystoma xenopodis TaxID=117903 RepID=A0A3S5FC42_9PLAT|nr:unnamed protein product [Protopolystoma xenopodis]
MTPGCIKTSAEVLSRINFSADPCVNFYNFACGRYSDEHEVPEEANFWSHLDEATKMGFLMRRRKLAQAVWEPADGLDLLLAQRYFASCLNTSHTPAGPAGDPPARFEAYLRHLRADFQGWLLLPATSWGSRTPPANSLLQPANFDLASLLSSLAAANDHNQPLFTLTVISDANSPAEPRVEVGRSRSRSRSRSLFPFGLGFWARVPPSGGHRRARKLSTRDDAFRADETGDALKTLSCLSRSDALAPSHRAESADWTVAMR